MKANQSHDRKKAAPVAAGAANRRTKEGSSMTQLTPFTYEGALVGRPSHLLPGLMDKGFNADRQMEGAPVDDRYRHVSLATQVAAKGDVFDSGVTRQLGYGFALKAGLCANHGTKRGVESFCRSDVVSCHALKATTTTPCRSHTVSEHSLTGLVL